MKKITKASALFLGAALTVASLSGCQNLVTNDPVTCTITDKDRSTEVIEGQSKSVFRIYVEGEGCDDTYGLADNIFKGNMNSSDFYGKLKVGKTYNLETVGVRNGFFSSFKEIVKATEVAGPTPSPSSSVK